MFEHSQHCLKYCLAFTYSHNIFLILQSTLVISTSLISNNRLSRSENLVPVLTQRSTNRQQNIVEKRRNCSLGAVAPLFHNIFNISLTQESNYIFILLEVVVRFIVFLSSANLICRSTDIAKCFIESLGFRDNESRLYLSDLSKLLRSLLSFIIYLPVCSVFHFCSNHDLRKNL